MRALVIAALLLAPLPVMAQEQHWTPAPEPSIGAGDTVLPTARVAGPISDDHSTPFSATPSDSLAGNGATSDDVTNGVQTPGLDK